jgi:L-aspartate oxidase
MNDDTARLSQLLDTPRHALPALPTASHRHTAPVLVVGGGVAGLAAALQAASGAEVTLLTRERLGESNSAQAQGGIAAALDAADSPRFHSDDTLVAGAGISDAPAVAALAREAPAMMHTLAAFGVPFERDEQDRFALGLEGGHSRRRIVHAADATGRVVTSVLIERARAHPHITILEGYQVVDLLGPGRCDGVLALDEAGIWHEFMAGATILATGGAGALYGLTSNQPAALGEGIAIAYRAGAEVADMEFVQFHPTVLRLRDGGGFLISEAARGEGGRLLTVTGERFMPAYDPRAELAPRDVVTRGIYAAMRRSGADYVLLDLTHLPRSFLSRRFPTIYQRCRAEGIDPVITPIPVAPAAHYLMGGIRTSLNGSTSLPGLYAAGECACTGVHGANRLASNSLLECLVFGRRAGAAAGSALEHASPPVAAGPPPNERLRSGPGAPPANWRAALAEVMRAHGGPSRTAEGLNSALEQITHLQEQSKGEPCVRPAAARSPEPGVAAHPGPARPPDVGAHPGPARPPDVGAHLVFAQTSEAITAANALTVARLIITSALLREESRGAHFRADFPQTSPAWHRHVVLRRGAAPRAVERIATRKRGDGWGNGGWVVKDG